MASHETSDRFTCACCGQNAPMPGREFPAGWGDPGATVRFCRLCAAGLDRVVDRYGDFISVSCLHLALLEVEREIEYAAFDDQRARRHLRVLLRRLRDGGTRDGCGCATCRRLAAARDLPRRGRPSAMVEPVPPSQRPPVDVSDVSTVTVRTFNGAQRCIVADGSVVLADEVVRLRLGDNHQSVTDRAPMLPWLSKYVRSILARGPDNTPREVRAQDDAFRQSYWADYVALGDDAARLNDVKRRFVPAMWNASFTPAGGYYDFDGVKLFWVELETGECFDISDILPEFRP